MLVYWILIGKLRDNNKLTHVLDLSEIDRQMYEPTRKIYRLSIKTLNSKRRFRSHNEKFHWLKNSYVHIKFEFRFVFRSYRNVRA